MSKVVEALSAFTRRASGIQYPSIDQAQNFQDNRQVDLPHAPLPEIVQAEIDLFRGAAFRFAYRTGEAISAFRSAHEGYLTFEHPDNVRAAALSAWAIAESFLYEDNFAEAKTWYWKALAIFTKLDGVGAESTRACLEDFQCSAHGRSTIISRQLRGIQRLSDMVTGKG